MYQIKCTLLALSLLASIAVSPILNGDIPANNSTPTITSSDDNLIAYVGWRADRRQARRGDFNDSYGYNRGWGFGGSYNNNPGYYSQSNSYQNGRFYNDDNRGFDLFSGGLFGCGCRR